MGNEILEQSTLFTENHKDLAVEQRQAKIFSLIYGLQEQVAIVSFRDRDDNNMLHKAAAVAPSRLLKLIPGAALQMQRELQ